MRFEPGTYWFGGIDNTTRLFSTQIGSLEKGRIYKYCFETRLKESQKDREKIATATLRYNLHSALQNVA